MIRQLSRTLMAGELVDQRVESEKQAVVVDLPGTAAASIPTEAAPAAKAAGHLT